MVVHYTLKELKKALADNSLWLGDRIPITKTRAVSLVNNPRADEDDVLLLVLYNDEKRVMGYYAVVPDFIFIDGLKEKLGWLAAFWAETSPENATAIVTLYLKACELWDFKVASSSFSKFGERLFDKSRMVFDFIVRKGFKAIVRFNTTYWIMRKFPKLKTLSFVFRIADFALNILSDLRLRLWYMRSNTKNIEFEFINEICEQELIDFIHKMNTNDLTRKSHEDLNYIMHYSDLLEVPLPDISNEKCFFGSLVSRNDNYAIKVMDKDFKIVAFAMINIVDKKLLFKYIYSLDEYKLSLYRLIGKIAIKKRVDMIESYNEDIWAGLKSAKFPFIYVKHANVRSVINNRYKKYNFENYDLHDGDGA